MQELPMSGLYIVTLNNEQLISVNAHDKRRADRVIKVNKDNCKFGKANILSARRENYYKTFGKENVNFKALVLLEDIQKAETLILRELDQYRIRSNSGRKNEWLAGVSPSQVEKIIFQCLDVNGFTYYPAAE